MTDNLTPPPGVGPNPDAVIDVVREQVEALPWYSRLSNTVTSGIGVALTGIWAATSYGLDVPEEATGIVYTVLAVATILGVYRAKNGETKALEKWSRDRLKLDG
ncbi:membrane protein [Gordonia phage Widow]|nr:membrane protein [Gordonia phage Widow]